MPIPWPIPEREGGWEWEWKGKNEPAIIALYESHICNTVHMEVSLLHVAPLRDVPYFTDTSTAYLRTSSVSREAFVLSSFFFLFFFLRIMLFAVCVKQLSEKEGLWMHVWKIR